MELWIVLMPGYTFKLGWILTQLEYEVLYHYSAIDICTKPWQDTPSSGSSMILQWPWMDHCWGYVAMASFLAQVTYPQQWSIHGPVVYKGGFQLILSDPECCRRPPGHHRDCCPYKFPFGFSQHCNNLCLAVHVSPVYYSTPRMVSKMLKLVCTPLPLRIRVRPHTDKFRRCYVRQVPRDLGVTGYHLIKHKSELLSGIAKKNPTLPIFVYADDQSLHGTTEITFLEFGRAAHRIAHALRPARQGDEGQVVMLIANTDTILHHAAVAGMSIAGLVPFLVSPRNSAAAVANMMTKTNCSRIVTLHHAHQSLIDGIRGDGSRGGLIFDELPTLGYAFPRLGNEVESDPFDAYPPPGSRPDLDKPAIYIHSSGSTGFPKPIAHSYKVQIHWMTQPVMEGFRFISAPRRLGVMALPAFHSYGMQVQLYFPIASLATAVLYPPRSGTDPRTPPVIPTSDNILETVRKTKCKILAIVPTFLEQWATSKDAVDELRKLDLVMYGGGPLAVKVGNALCAAGVTIGAGYGGTEFGGPVLTPNKKDIVNGDWNWFRFADYIRWVPQGDGTFECQVLTTETNQMAVENLPDVKGYATSDLFVKHPTKNMWKIVGRVDDVITLASGEKTVPAPMEGIVASSLLLDGAVMFGRERTQVGILIEPRPEHSWDREKGLFPEEIQLDPSPAVGTGYGESKYVCERIIVNSGLHATSLRIGQIAGGPNGSWATTDWVPIIVKSSIALGALPDACGIVSWMRAEEVAASVLDVAFTIKASPPALNIVNPRGAPWSDVMSSVRDAILKQKSLGSEELSMVPFKDWFDRLEKKSEGASSEDLVNIPAIKLLEFFRRMVLGDERGRTQTATRKEAGGITDFRTTKSQLVSKTMAQMRPVGAVEARSWVQYWISKGLF
ncbi:acetyl-CoA synthetase-like protein [Gyrodon lividus]|nr:acetyl-CoA synthetase-like protein [Gyrodon lividus]